MWGIMHRSLFVFVLLGACGDNHVGNTPPTIEGLNLTTAEDTPLTRLVETADAEDDQVTITLGQPANGDVALSGSSFTYTPDANYHGTDSFTVTVSDGRDEATATVNITVTPVNDPPVGMPDSFATNEDVAHEAELTALLANDSDVDGDTLTITAVGSASNGSVAMVGEDVVFTPTTDFVGNGSYTYTLSDGTLTTEVTVTVTIGGVNDGPVATDDTGTTDEDTDFVVTAATLTANDTDPEGQTLTVTSVDNFTNGAATLDQGTVTFVPTANFSGTASFEYTVSDGASTDTATVTITVAAVNDVPVAVDDAATTNEDTAVTIAAATLLANDSDVESTPTITSTGNVVGGTLATDANGDFVFTPTPNFFGAASFEYTITDGDGATDTAVVAITVTSVQDAPVAVDDAATTNEDTPLAIAAATLLANDSDVDGDTLTITSVGNAAGGSVTLDANTGEITFTPTANASGTASFDYTIGDGNGGSDTGTVTVTVTAVNDPPVANDDTGNTAEDTPVVFAQADLVGDDTDVENDTLTISSVGNAVNGTVTLDANTNAVTFTPALDFAGAASFEYTISDGNNGSDTATVAVTVSAVNDAPTANGDTAQAMSGVAANYPTSQFLANDTDPDGPAALSITAVANPSNGTVLLNGNTITYQSAPAFLGQATFEYTVFDGVASSTGIVTVNVVDGLACGDSFIAGAETCDDGNTDPGDGCSSICQEEVGWDCTGQPSTCTPVCGDNVVVADEVCDDGNTDETDGCTSECVVGVVCNDTAFPGGDRFAVEPTTGTCYAAFDGDQTTFADAQAACVALGGHLVTITSAGEQALVASVQNDAENPWIGASEDGNDTDAVFDWVTDDAFGFTAFEAGQPDDDAGVGGTGDCLHLTNAAGEWNDTNCNFAGFVTGRICELAVETCGDAIVQSAQSETCDDGNTTSGDGCSATCQLEPFVTFSFTTALGNEASFPADSQAQGLDAMPTMVRGPGLTTANTAANAFTADSWTTAAAIDVTDYYSFTVTPAAGVSMRMTALELDERRSGSGPRTWAVRSSLDGFTTDLATFAVPDDTNTRTNQRIDLGAAFNNLTTAVEFRIYAYGAELAGGTWRIDNVELTGVLTLP